ncbi:hypothetical protein GCM10020331_084340 [Ectobacillus funiculus]
MKNGLWHTLLNDPSSYVEASCTAGFAFGTLKAIRKRHVDKKIFEYGIKKQFKQLLKISMTKGNYSMYLLVQQWETR